MNAILVAIAAAAAVVVWAADPDLAIAGAGTASLVLFLAVAGALAATRRPWLTAAAVAWCAALYASPAAPSAVLFTLGLAIGAAAPAAVALALMSNRRAGLVLAFASAGLLGALAALVFDPSASGCADCPRNLLLVHGDAHAFEILQRAGLWLGLAAIAWLVVTSRLLTVSAYLVAVAAQYVHGLPRGYLATDTTDHTLWALQGFALLAVTAGLGWKVLRVRRARARLARLVVELETRSQPRGLRDVLADVLEDASLQLAYRIGERRLDAQARPLAPRARQQITALGDDAELYHAPGLPEDAAPAIASAARLTLRNERLHAELSARLEELRAIRGRIVATADRERRQLERDLHDGAQQRLATLAVLLETVRLRARPEHAATFTHAQADVRTALGQVRDIAHGLVPAVLADLGLGPAVEALAETTDLQLPHPLPEDRFPPAVETTAYHVVNETVRRAGQASVQFTRGDRGLVLAIVTPAPPRDITDLDDRVGALGGTLARTEHGLTAELPCG